MILTIIFFALLAIAGFVELYSEAVPEPRAGKLRLAMNLIEAAIILSMMQLYGWQLGLGAFCFLVALMIMTAPLARCVHKHQTRLRRAG